LQQLEPWADVVEIRCPGARWITWENRSARVTRSGLLYLELRVEACDVLQDLSELANVDRAESIVLKNNANLTSLDGIDTLTELGSLSLIENPKLAELDGLSNLMRLGSTRIEHNPLLTSLEGLRDVDGFTTCRASRRASGSKCRATLCCRSARSHGWPCG
jgi:hypothetical protein